MSFWTLERLRSVLGASWGSVPPAASVEAAGVSTDSRSIGPGQLFIALRGERTDGHLYLDAAARASAAAAVIASDHIGPAPAGLPLLRVPDTARALLRLGAAYRRTLIGGTRVVAVTGSNGKTTTTRMIDAVLSGSLRGTAPIKSFNNHIGVPLTILRARAGDHYLVCEVGTNAPGEVETLAEAVAPDVSVIVSIGREHLEKLGTVEQVAREEAAQLEFLRPGGLAVVNADAPYLAEIVAARAGGGPGATREFNVVTFGTRRDADLRVAVTRQDDQGTEFTINGRHRFRLPMLGRHNAVNAAAAIAVGRRFGLEFDAISAALARVRGPEMRLDPGTAGGVRVINDAYNANPESMAAALAVFSELAPPPPPHPGRRVLVLGDMLELGGHSDSAHTEAVHTALERATGADLVVLVGPLMARASRAVRDPRLRRVEDPSDGPVSSIAALLNPGDVVLLKGSRRLRLERVVKALEARPPQALSA